MFLPGETAKMYRSGMAKILHRYFAGDKSMLEEIEANAASDSPVAQMARASLPEDRKRKMEFEDTQLHALKIKNIDAFVTVMERINPLWRDDTRLRLKTEDWVKNVAFGTSAITNGSADESISVSQVAHEMGHNNLAHGQLVQIGRLIARKYRAKHSTEPPVHRQWVDGAERWVKSYTERDRQLIEDAIAEVI